MNKRGRTIAMQTGIGIAYGNNTNIYEERINEPDCYIDMSLWSNIQHGYARASAYWLRQYILECLMDMAIVDLQYGMMFDPYDFFPPDSDGSGLEVLIYLAFSEHDSVLRYYEQNRVQSIIQRYTEIVRAGITQLAEY